ncbi:MAG: tetratricopeptide repeat protein, partial [Planctomycetota bacterium]
YNAIVELVADIARHLNLEPVLAGPPSQIYRLKKFIRKHRVKVISVATVVILLVSTAAVTYIWAYNQGKEAEFLKHEAILLALEADERIKKEAKFREHEAVLSEAQRLLSGGQYQNALTEVETILNSERIGPEARLLFGRLQILVGRFSDAEAVLRKLLGEEPKIAGTAHYLLATIYMGNDPPKAELHQKSAEELLPQAAEAYYLRAMAASSLEERLEHLNKAVDLDRGHYDSLKARALTYYATKEYRNIERDAVAMITLRAQDPLGYSLLAIAVRETGDFAVALKYHNRAIELSRDDPELYNQRYETYQRMGNHQAALEDARRCVELEPEQYVYYFHVFTALVSLGDYKAARREHRKIVHDDIVQQQQFEAWAQRYVFSVLGAGQPFELPADIKLGEAFTAMQEAAKYYRKLKTKAKRLVPGVYGQSSWSPDSIQLAYGRSDLYAWQPKMYPIPAISGSSGIEILNLESGKKRLLVSFGKDPAWSPDGQNIAFVREPKRIRDYEEEVWIVPAEGGQPTKIAQGAWPIWSHDSKTLFYHSRVDNMLYSIRIDEPLAKRKRVISCRSRFPWISPDEKYVAYAEGNKLKIVELSTERVETKWTAPLPASGMLVRWSPNGKELSVAGLTGSDLGLWIFDVEREKAWQIFDAPAISGIWTPDMSKMVIKIKIPFEENWLVTLDPNMPTYQALAPALTPPEFMHHRLEQCTHSIELDPLNANNYLSRALVYARLQEYEKATADLEKVAKHLSGEQVNTSDIRNLNALMNNFTQRGVEQYDNGLYKEA